MTVSRLILYNVRTSDEPYRWRDPTQASEEHWQVNLPPEVLLCSPTHKPYADRCNGSNQERPDKWSVKRSRSEEPLGAHNAPQNAAIEVNFCDGTSEAVDGLRRADIRNVCKHPVQHTYLREA